VKKQTSQENTKPMVQINHFKNQFISKIPEVEYLILKS